MYVKVKTADGQEILDEVSLKKDKNANLLNLTTGRVGDIIIRGKASTKEMKEYERLAAKSNNFRKVSNLSDDEREFLKQLQEQYVVDVPDDVDVEKFKSRQAEMHRNSLKENTQEIREAIQNFNNLSDCITLGLRANLFNAASKF